MDLFFQIAAALGVLAVGLLAAYGALSFGWTDLAAWAGYLSSAAWPETTAHITHSDIIVHRTRRGAVYEPDVRYAYTVDGQRYTGRRLTFSSWSQWLFEADVKRALEPFPVGAVVAVRYDPRRPGSAVLVRRAPRSPLTSCLVVALLLGTSALCLAAATIGFLEGP
jgi:hypothetical protein